MFELVDDFVVAGERLVLRSLTLSDVGPRYVDWLNDPEVNMFLETRHSIQTIESVEEYVVNCQTVKGEYLLAVCRRKDGVHIGNLKLGAPVNYRHKTGVISLFIGEKKHWGCGYGSEAIDLALRFGFNVLDLNKITAGCYASNVGSRKAFEKNGFRVEGIQRQQYMGVDGPEDGILLGLLRTEWDGA